MDNYGVKKESGKGVVFVGYFFLLLALGYLANVDSIFDLSVIIFIVFSILGIGFLRQASVKVLIYGGWTFLVIGILLLSGADGFNNDNLKMGVFSLILAIILFVISHNRKNKVLINNEVHHKESINECNQDEEYNHNEEDESNMNEEENVVICKSCGSRTIIKGNVGKCEYCDSVLS